jgi:predicted HicB family RNase H-like nuclease
MKWIKDGVTYNTDTSTPVARYVGEPDNYDPKRKEMTLHQTQGGAFFLHIHETWAVKRDGQWVELEHHNCMPMTQEQAQKWVMEEVGDAVEILSDAFPAPPEAEEEPAGSTTIYLRVPASLKQRIERAAKKADQSMNVWAMRCLESCSAAAAE